MITTLHVRVCPGDAVVPLVPIRLYSGSALTVQVEGVPRPVGLRKVTAVSVAVRNVDGTTVSTDAVLSGGLWTASFDGDHFVTSGASLKGVQISATGTDERGDAFGPWILAKGDLVVLDATGTVQPGSTLQELHWWSSIPTTLHPGDCCPVEGVVKMWDGESWREFGPVTSAITREDVASLEADLDPDESSQGDVMRKVNEIINTLKGTVALIAVALASSAFGAGVTVQTAKLADLPGKTQVATNVTFSASGLATTTDLVAATNALPKVTDSTVSAWGYIKGISWAGVTGKPTFATVATTGSYDDLTSKPVIPSAVTDSTVAGWGYIKSLSWANLTGKPSWIGNAKPTYSWGEISQKPTAVSYFNNDAGYITGYTETDPTVPSWAKATSKPTYAWTEITSRPTIPTDSTVAGWGYIKSYTETDPSVYAWAKAAVKPTYAWSEITSRPTIPNDSTVAGWGYIKSYTETDPTVPSWAKTTSKPTYAWSEITSKPGIVMTNGQNRVDYLSWTLRGRVDDISADGNIIYFKQIAPQIAPEIGHWYFSGQAASVQNVSWNSITSHPNTLLGYDITDAYTKTQIDAKRFASPNSITIKTNGVAAVTYDGSVAKTIDLSLGGGGGGGPGGTVAAATLEYHADGQAIEVTVAAAGTFSATLTGWPDGQSQMAFVTLAAGASVSPSIKLIGYSEWTVGEEFMAVATRRGNKIYVNPVCITEE